MPGNESFSRRMFGNPPWKRRPNLLLPAVVLLVVTCGLPGFYAWRLLTARPAIATVEHCDYHSKSVDCRGTWRLDDGTTGSGGIDAVYAGDVGHSVRVWVSLGSATANRLDWAVWPIMGLVVDAGSVIFILRLRRRNWGSPPELPR